MGFDERRQVDVVTFDLPVHALTLRTQLFSFAIFLADAGRVAQLYAADTGSELRSAEVGAQLAIEGNRELLLAALGNLLQNAFKLPTPCDRTNLGG